jgi:hypothetical protein
MKIRKKSSKVEYRRKISACCLASPKEKFDRLCRSPLYILLELT